MRHQSHRAKKKKILYRQLSQRTQRDAFISLHVLNELAVLLYIINGEMRTFLAVMGELYGMPPSILSSPFRKGLTDHGLYALRNQQ